MTRAVHWRKIDPVARGLPLEVPLLLWTQGSPPVLVSLHTSDDGERLMVGAPFCHVPASFDPYSFDWYTTIEVPHVTSDYSLWDFGLVVPPRGEG